MDITIDSFDDGLTISQNSYISLGNGFTKFPWQQVQYITVEKHFAVLIVFDIKVEWKEIEGYVQGIWWVGPRRSSSPHICSFLDPVKLDSFQFPATNANVYVNRTIFEQSFHFFAIMESCGTFLNPQLSIELLLLLLLQQCVQDHIEIFFYLWPN